MVKVDIELLHDIVSTLSKNSEVILQNIDNKNKKVSVQLSNFEINNSDLDSKVNTFKKKNADLINSLYYGLRLYENYFNNFSLEKIGACSIAKLANFSRNVIVNGRKVHYFAQNDLRWRDTFIKGTNNKKTRGLSGCQQFSIINSLASLGYYEGFKSEEEFINLIFEYVSQCGDNLALIVINLNNYRKNRMYLPPCNSLKQLTNRQGGSKESRMEIAKLALGLKDNESGYYTYNSETSSLIEQINSLEKAARKEGVEFQYSVTRLISNPKDENPLTQKSGHYVTINDFEFDENGNVTYVYIYDSDVRDIADTIVKNKQGKNVTIGGYNRCGDASNMKIITPGIIKVKASELSQFKFGSGKIIITKKE